MLTKQQKNHYMTRLRRIQVDRPRLKLVSWPGRFLRLTSACVAMLLSLKIAHAAFHLWAVTEVYSSPDGSVQFVRLTNNSVFNGENLLNGHVITCSAPLGTHSFSFPSNLSSTATLNKNFLIGTANLASVPGGLTPDYVFTNSVPFLFLNGGGATAVGITSSFETPASYTTLPADGQSSLVGFGSSLAIATNSPKNFNNQSNTVVPVKFVSGVKVDTNFVMTFRTATGVNGSAGPNYTVEYKNLLSDSSWTPLPAISGDGTTKSVSNSIASSPQRLFRLRAP